LAVSSGHGDAASVKNAGGERVMTTRFEAEELLETVAAGYVALSHPDARRAWEILGEKKAKAILRNRTSECDAMQKVVPGCAGAARRQ